MPEEKPQEAPTSSWIWLWKIYDTVVLLQMGTAYRMLFAEFERDEKIDGWRDEQQKEWDRLSVTLGLLATMFCAGLAINNTPPFAFAIWLGGAGLSICGVLIINYFPVKAFGISNDDMAVAVQEGNDYIDVSVLAAAAATPVILALWSSMIFLVGIIDYIIEVNLHGAWYKALAAIPVVAGVLSCVTILLVGERLGKRIQANQKRSGDVDDKTLTPTSSCGDLEKGCGAIRRPSVRSFTS